MNIWQQAREKHAAARKAMEGHLAECEKCKPDLDLFCQDFPQILQAAMDAPEYPEGQAVIAAFQCPRNAAAAVACMFCPNGHMLECHHPLSCEQARCSHWLQESMRQACSRDSNEIADKIYEHFCGPDPRQAGGKH